MGLRVGSRSGTVERTGAEAMFEIVMILIGGFFGVFAVIFAICNYIIIFSMWRKGLEKPLFGLVGPICVLISMWFILREVNWIVFWIASAIDPGGIITVVMSVKYLCYDRYRGGGADTLPEGED